ncbi:NERD domain-containing protein [Terribacillus saccharophilus]|uniref:NERD domain-containing protein n=1 Tax=Terribacillus saccharophilus TaxID=361277 RepID=UPI0039829D05
MAQLIKLHEYISRYEQHPYRYPGQFIKLKKENWEKKHKEWEQQQAAPAPYLPEEEKEETNKKAWYQVFRKKDQEEDIEENPAPVYIAPTEGALKQDFLEELFDFQLKWATSTLGEFSFIDHKYKKDPILRYFLKRFPDTFFVMYKPVFEVKQTTMEAETILIHPLGIEIITVLEDKPEVLFWTSDERTWKREAKGRFTTFLNPMLSLNRTEKLVQGILRKYDIDLPIQKTVLSRENQIRFVSEPRNTKFIGSQKHTAWLMAKRQEPMALKHIQLRASEVLLEHSFTKAVARPEWEAEEKEEFFS